MPLSHLLPVEDQPHPEDVLTAIMSTLDTPPGGRGQVELLDVPAVRTHPHSSADNIGSDLKSLLSHGLRVYPKHP